MAKLEKITVLDILEEYKSLIKNNFRNYIKFVLTEEDMEVFTQEVDSEMKIIKNGADFKDYKEIKTDLEYEIVEAYLKNNTDINADDKIKLKILGQIYKEFSDKMDKKTFEKLKYTILGRREYAIFKFKTQEDGDLIEYELLTKDEPKKASDIRKDRKRELFTNAVFEILSVDDIEGIINEKYVRDVASVIVNKIAFNFFIRQKRVGINEYKQIIENGHIDEQYDKEFEAAIKEYLKNNLQLLDETNLLLNAATRVVLGIKLFKGEKIEEIALGTTSVDGKIDVDLMSSIRLLKDIYDELGGNEYINTPYSIYGKNGVEIIRVDRERIREILQRCTTNDYITDSDIETIHGQIIEGTLPEDTKTRKIANIEIQDLMNLSINYDKKDNDKEKNKLLECAVELAEYLKAEGLTTNKKLLNLYFDGEINLDIIKNIDMSEITSEEYNQKFKMIYDRILYSISEEEKETEEQKLSRLAELYKHLETEGKTDIDNLIAMLLTAYGEEYGAEVMADLYELEIVNFEKCVDWVGIPVLKELCKREKLPPAKVREFFESKKKDEELDKILDEIAEIINVSPNIMQRVMLIGSVFPEDEETRNKLLKKCLSIESTAREKTEGNLKREHTGGTTGYTKNIIDSYDRIALMELIDDDCYFEEVTLDGHVIMHLPNFQEVIVEKMYNKKKESEHGAATYILSEEYFKRNRSVIIQNGKVHRQKMIEDRGNKDVEKIEHFLGSWGRKIKEHFGIEEGSRYNKEKLQKIDEIIKRIQEKGKKQEKADD